VALLLAGCTAKFEMLTIVESGASFGWDPLQDPAACTEEDPFYDYDGVVRGVMEDGCQVLLVTASSQLALI
jgi:hypothetical protein